MAKYTEEELNTLSKEQLVKLFCSQQEQLDSMNRNLEAMIEQIRIMNQNRFGRHTERLDQIEGQLSLFNEAECTADTDDDDPEDEETVIVKRKKKKNKRKEDFRDLPKESHPHPLTDEQLDAFFGKGCWRKMKSEEYIRLRCKPAEFTVEEHTVDVAVGTDGDHQDEFLRGDRPKDLMDRCIATPSVMAAILNAKYTNAMPLNRISEEFLSNGINISRQTMSNWTIRLSSRYIEPFRELLIDELLHDNDVIQADETTCQVVNDNDPSDPDDHKGRAGHKNYMWVYRTGQFNKGHPIVIYDYQRTRHHDHPMEFLKGFTGTLETDGLQQYHMLEGLLGIINANCWTHARRDFSDAVKAVGRNNKAAKKTIAYQALVRIAAMFKIESTLSEMTADERLKERQKSIAPLVDEFFAWVKERLADTSVMPSGKTAEGLNYCVNHEKYLRVFLTNGNVPMDNSASERAIRPFTVGRKNWVLIDSVKGAKASAAIYSIVQTAKLNNLRVYNYLEYILTEMKDIIDEDGHMDKEKLKPLLPWSDQLPQNCYKNNR